tara:strand:+ start:480 stop:653 length:174 start_codon:yes stop_codon:yes gene_type:complete
MYEFTIPLELFLVGGLMLVAAIMERRDRAYAAEWQLILDRLHHGTEIKPYDWELEES